MHRSLLALAMMLAAGPTRAAQPTAAQILAATSPAPPPGYVIDAVRVGITAKAERSLFIRDPRLPAKLRIAFTFWVVRGPGRTILLDTGFFDPAMKRRWRVRDFRDPAQGLAALGIDVEEVTDVVISHHHWDHIGGLARFPQATMWITADALNAARAWAKKNDGDLIRVLNEAQRVGRIRLTEQLENLTPHLLTVSVGLHGPGFQYLLVHNPGGRWILASDVVPLDANLARGRATGLTTDATATRVIMETMLEIVGGDATRIIAGHEPVGFDANGLRRIVAPTEQP